MVDQYDDFSLTLNIKQFKFIMKKILLSFSVLALVVAFGACKKSSSTPPNTSSVMFVHACTAGSTPITLDARANNNTVSGASGLTFLKNSGYQQVTAGTAVNLAFNVTGLSLLTSGTSNLTTNAHDTAFAGGSILAPSFVLASDDLTLPTSGKAKIRFVNLCADGLNTSCYFSTTKLDSNVGYKTVTPFVEVIAGTGKLSMIDQVVLSNSADVNAQVLTAGKIYTAYLTGSVTGVGSSILTLTVINNN
jgi:Domain of unknown function (DUF4397)